MRYRELMLCMGSLAALSAPLSRADPPAGTESTADATRVNHIAVGDGTLDGAFVTPYDNVWLCTVTGKDGKVRAQGLWSDHVEFTSVATRQALKRVQGMTYVNGKTTSTVNVFEPRTLAPISSRWQGVNGETLERNFSGGHIVSIRSGKDGAPPTTNAVDLAAAPYDFNGGMYGLVLAALPLRAGLSGTFNAIDEFEDKASVEAFRVIGQEDVPAGARGSVKAWRVESERPGQYKMTFWLTKSAPFIIKLEYLPANGTDLWDWLMI